LFEIEFEIMQLGVEYCIYILKISLKFELKS